MWRQYEYGTRDDAALNSFRCIQVLLKSLILLFFATVSLGTSAEWSGALRSGYSYTDNLGSQITVEQGLGTSDVESRSGWANQGNLVLKTLNMNGGQALELFGLYDFGLYEKSNDNTWHLQSNDHYQVFLLISQ